MLHTMGGGTTHSQRLELAVYAVAEGPCTGPLHRARDGRATEEAGLGRRFPVRRGEGLEVRIEQHDKALPIAHHCHALVDTQRSSRDAAGLRRGSQVSSETRDQCVGRNRSVGHRHRRTKTIQRPAVGHRAHQKH